MTDKTERIPVRLDDNTVVMIEVDKPRGERNTSGKDKEEPIRNFDPIIESIQSMTKKLKDAMADAQPDKLTLELGVEIGVETNGLVAIFAKGTGKSHMKISLEWEKSR